MPPSALSIDNFSINGLKAVYMICYQNDYFMKSDIDFESIMFISTSLAFSLREYFYKQYQSQKQHPFLSVFLRVMYNLMDVFVDIDSYFKYDESLTALNETLRHSTNSFFYLKLMIICRSCICYILTPIFSFFSIGPVDSDGLSSIMYYTYLAYTVISFFFEIFFLTKLLNLTRHLIPDIPLAH